MQKFEVSWHEVYRVVVHIDDEELSQLKAQAEEDGADEQSVIEAHVFDIATTMEYEAYQDTINIEVNHE